MGILYSSIEHKSIIKKLRKKNQYILNKHATEINKLHKINTLIKRDNCKLQNIINSKDKNILLYKTNLNTLINNNNSLQNNLKCINNYNKSIENKLFIYNTVLNNEKLVDDILNSEINCEWMDDKLEKIYIKKIITFIKNECNGEILTININNTNEQEIKICNENNNINNANEQEIKIYNENNNINNKESDCDECDDEYCDCECECDSDSNIECECECKCES